MLNNDLSMCVLGYEKIVTIPKGARSIHVRETKPNKNTLAVRLEKSNTYCLNGNM